MKLPGGILLLLSSATAAQSPGDEPPAVNYPNIPAESAALTDIVPKGWILESKATGDLNGDRLPDAALVLHMHDPGNFVSSDWDPDHKYDSNPRMLVIAFARKAGNYEARSGEPQTDSAA